MARVDEGPTGVLLLDKPLGRSSTQVLAAAKRHLGSKKAGHTGTLDPFATGLLPLAFGEATKFSRFVIDSRKGYIATLRLGYTSTTGDPEGVVVRQSPCFSTCEEIDEVLSGFAGVHDQIPPMHSAIHHEGRRLYELAREGIEVPRVPRRVEIEQIKQQSKSNDLLEISVICSKGTYIRTLAQDIGNKLGCGAYLVALRRNLSGPFTIEQAIGLDALQELPREEACAHLLPPECLVLALPRVLLEAGIAARAANGMTVPTPVGMAPGEAAIYAPGGRFLGVACAGTEGWMSPVRLMADRGSGPVFA